MPATRAGAVMAIPGMPVISTPLPVAGYTAWYDFSNDSAVTVATGISQVVDLSGNGFHLYQATTTRQPAHTTNPTLGGGVLKVAQFGLTLLNLMSDVAGPIQTPSTIFVTLLKRSTNFTQNRVATQMGALGILDYNLTSTTAMKLSGTGFTVPSNQAPMCLTFSSNTTATQVFVNGAATQAVSRNHSQGTSSGGRLSLGSYISLTNHGDYDFGEFVIYPTKLSAGDQVLVEDHLISKWGVTPL